jgi:hypothetical protein
MAARSALAVAASDFGAAVAVVILDCVLYMSRGLSSLPAAPRAGHDRSFIDGPFAGVDNLALDREISLTVKTVHSNTVSSSSHGCENGSY